MIQFLKKNELCLNPNNKLNFFYFLYVIHIFPQQNKKENNEYHHKSLLIEYKLFY